jgi:glycerol-3-phosphate O-acyltransferase
MNRAGERLIGMASRVMGAWVRPEVVPEDMIERVRTAHADPAVRLCYVLESGGLADLLALEGVCRKHGLPLPQHDLEYAGIEEPKSVIVLRRMRGFIFRRPSVSLSARLGRMITAGTEARDTDAATVDALPLLLVPVGIYWGRAPSKERSWLDLFFSEDWDVAGRLRKFLTTLLLGRSTLVQFSEPLAVGPILAEGLDAERSMRKVSRVLRVHFRLRRQATVGPDLSHRRTLIDQVLRADAVRDLVASEGTRGSRGHNRAQKKARKYAYEIAADLSYPTVRVLERMLAWVWNRIYDGIKLNGIERLRAAADGNELVYVPCHRSHFDYLLLSYILYRQGLSLPYVAAGINLNIPVVGSILRRGGAFFLRRSFSGNRLYAAVFQAYLRELQTRGYPIEYFIEGGRSRTGRMLDPKVGMLSMTTHAFLQDSRRPVRFVPVYFGYEKLIEGRAFIDELTGEAKKKESLFGFFRSLKALREHFGEVYVNIGEPIDLAALLDEQVPDWREQQVGIDKPEWLPPVVNNLAGQVQQRINAAAAVTPISLLAVSLLATPRQTMAEADLRRQIDLYRELLERTPYSHCVTLPELDGEGIIEHGLKLDVVAREDHPLGPLIGMRDQQAVLLTYFRNNILHLVAIYSMIAACYVHARQLQESELKRLVHLTFPYLRSELCLRWRRDEVNDVVLAAIAAMEQAGLLRRTSDGKSLRRAPAGSPNAFQLFQLGQSVVPLLQRYYMTMALLNKYGSGALTQASLEKVCQLCAERLSIVYGLRSPDFFDRKLFQNFLRTLLDMGAISVDEAGNLTYDEAVARIEGDARLVLGDSLRHSILSVTEVELPDEDDD